MFRPNNIFWLQARLQTRQCQTGSIRICSITVRLPMTMSPLCWNIF